MKLENLAHQVSAPSNYPRGMVTFDTALWNLLAEYRERREQSGFVRLAARVMLGLVEGGERLESAADHIVVSCTNDDILDLVQHCNDLVTMLRYRYEVLGE
jgi:hypothetical protein